MRRRGDLPLGNGNAIAFSYEGQGCYMHKDEGTEKSCRFLMIVLLMGLVVGVGEVWHRIATLIIYKRRMGAQMEKGK